MLEQYISPTMVSVLFATGSALSIILTLTAPRLLRRIGVVQSCLILLVLSSLVLSILGSTKIVPLVIGAFVVYFALTVCIFYIIDILIEHYSKDADTGKIRGTALTINNIGWIGMPAVVGVISTLYGFSIIYIFSAITICVAGIILALTQRDFVENQQVQTVRFKQSFLLIKESPELRRIISINFLLQFFYSWMVIYVPLYLVKVLHIPWATIGIIFSIMLIPFVLFQYISGRIADKWLGEKELIIFSFIVMAGTVGSLGILTTPSVIVLMILLFGTRVGASILEVMCDSYFFKQVNDTNTGIISFYRTMQPFAYIIGPISGAILLLFVSYTTMFLLLTLFLILGAIYSTRLVDTR